jgi:HK97 gp10 family phage protein
MTINVRGLEGLQEQLRAVGAEMGRDALTKAARAAFKRVAETAKQLVPADTGALRESIAVRAAKPKSGAVVAVGLAITANSTRAKQARVAAALMGESQSKALPPSRRWHFVELGTSKRGARPFLRPALDMNAQGVIDDLGGQLRKKIAAAIKAKSRGAK